MNNNPFQFLKEQKGKYDIYVELDALFDTRLALFAELDPEATRTAIESGEYHKRITDAIGDVPHSVFRLYYKYRTKYLLKNAYPTYMWQTVKAYHAETIRTVREGGLADELNVYVNIHPYELDEAELEWLLAMFATYAPGLKITYLSLPNEDISPNWVKQTCGSMYKYDALQWLEYHYYMGNLTKETLAHTDLYYPCLYNPGVGYTFESANYLYEIVSLITQPFPLRPQMFSAYALDKNLDQVIKDLQQDVQTEQKE